MWSITPSADRLARSALPAASLPSFTRPLGAGTLVPSAGRVPAVRVGHEVSRLDFGRERLFRWLNQLAGRRPQVAVFVGDSNTEGRWGAAVAALFAGLSGVTTINNGLSGTTVSQWANNTGAIAGTGRGLASVLGAAPDLLVIAYGGTNEPLFGVDPEGYLADLDAALTTIRSSANGSVGRLSIVLVTAATQGSGVARFAGGETTDEYFLARARRGIAALAHKHVCAFFDRAGRFPDSTVDLVSGSIGANTWLDDNRLHTLGAHTTLLARSFFNWIAPSEIRTERIIFPSLGAGFTLPSGEEALSLQRLTIGSVLIEGYVNGPVTPLPAGRPVGTLPPAWRPRTPKWSVSARLFDGTLPMELTALNISTAGEITLASATTRACSRLYIDATFSVPT